MGIDIYMRWKGMTEAEKKAQYTGYSVEAGHVGYLREAYHGAPYATKVLVPEAFESENCEAQIPAATLRERLMPTMQVAVKRDRAVYKSGANLKSKHIATFGAFVALAEIKEKETGEPVTIVASY